MGFVTLTGDLQALTASIAEIIEHINSKANPHEVTAGQIGVSEGNDGADGKTVLNGAVAPNSEAGALNDFYIDTAEWKIYGPKTAEGWGNGVSLIGSQGSNGKTILNGTEAPASDLGAVGDLYINTNTKDLYGPKTAEGWGSAFSLVPVTPPEAEGGGNVPDLGVIWCVAGATSEGADGTAAHPFGTLQAAVNQARSQAPIAKPILLRGEFDGFTISGQIDGELVLVALGGAKDSLGTIMISDQPEGASVILQVHGEPRCSDLTITGGAVDAYVSATGTTYNVYLRGLEVTTAVIQGGVGGSGPYDGDPEVNAYTGPGGTGGSIYAYFINCLIGSLNGTSLGGEGSTQGTEGNLTGVMTNSVVGTPNGCSLSEGYVSW